MVLSLAFPLQAILGLGAVAVDRADVDTVQAALDGYVSTIRSLSGQFRWTLTPSAEQKPRGLLMENKSSVVNFEIDLVTGRRRFDDRRTWIYSGVSNEPFEHRVITAFDGRLGYSLNYTHTKDPVDVGLPIETPHYLSVGGSDKSWTGLSVEEMAGLRSGGLAARLRSQSLRPDGREAIEGVSCYRLVASSDDRQRRTVIWLDPAHGYLPRRMEGINLGKPQKPARRDRDVFEMTEFREYPVPGGAKVWFPVRGKVHTWIDTVETLEILELQINPAIPESAYRIDPASLPDGVRVSGLGPVFYTGGNKALWKERDQLYDEHSRIISEKLGLPPPELPPLGSPPPKAPTIPAQPPVPSRWFGWAIGAVSLVLLAAGLMTLRAQRRRASV